MTAPVDLLVPAARDSRIPALSDFDVHFGIPVSAIGEDGNLIALGHHTPKAALAAFNAYARRTIGLVDLLDGRGRWQEALDGVKQCRAVLLTEHCRDCADPEVRDAACGQCWEIRDAAKGGSWWIAYDAAEDEPGAFPVTVWRC